MIGKIIKSQNFRATLRYVLQKEKGELIAKNMGGRNVNDLTDEFRIISEQRPKLKKACSHVILSVPHREDYHENLTDDQYTEIAERWLKEMGYTDAQYAIARHHDTGHEHIHIVANRVRVDGTVVPDSWDYRRSEKILRQIENDYGLEPTPCSNERTAKAVQAEGIEATVSGDRKAPTQRQKHHESGKPSVTQRLQDKIDQACRDNPTMTQLIGRLQRQGVKVHPAFTTRGNFREAVAFELDGVKLAGNKLGKAYSFPGLQKKRGVGYDRDRDLPAIKKAAEEKPVARQRKRTTKELEI